ncbi:indole-diterpene biosynthesis protein-like protein PaxU [Lophiostoma macrostomum CBS 122681]|uniref:Indole-diterpene biosynthesis protein-like protein PaxU n=1 Tax=Lophiostoma macrostomum CBS 122681 TaxID=1314788 RepID=A0A6A6SUZ2_9PLEO|nr:indole-diterpene biosynthesis protein-like protein PaxU [Lophiostoma macrostomum CBS 122681]
MPTKTTQITPTTVTKPLSDFQTIGYNTYLYTAESYKPPETPLVLIFAWNAAAAKHIAKYTVAYKQLIRNGRFLLIRCDTRDMYRKAKTYERLLTPALNVVKEHVKLGGKVLCHSFSNGGANQLAEFAKAWKRREGTLMPMRAQIVDSAPGKGGWLRSHAAIMYSLPQTLLWRWFGWLAIHLMIASIFAYNKVTGAEHKFLVLWRELNDPTIFDARTPRVYLYSKVDKMVGDDEVEEHADAAIAMGRDVVKVRFENSPHAGHVREDEGKYWGAVMGAWKRGPASE